MILKHKIWTKNCELKKSDPTSILDSQKYPKVEV